MPPTLSPQAFVARWRVVHTTERASAQSHFNDLCALLGQPTPIAADPQGEWYTFERGATKTAGPTKGQHGWADVWRRGAFAWEYKGKHADLDRAYQQLLQYRESLENPPLLVVCDLATIHVHTNITNTVKQIYTWTLDDLLDPARLDQLRRVWTDPFALRPAVTTAQVTEQAAREFAKLAELLRKWGEPAPQAAQFLIRCLFCLFAEDVGLLPARLFTRVIEATRASPADFRMQLGQLWAAMRSGGIFALERIAYFNGGLFADDTVLALDSDGIGVLLRVAGLDWGSIEPAIFGTLFERSLDPAKRAQLGAHYTSRDDILLIVEPVVLAPLRRRWAEVRAQAEALAQRRDAASGTQRTRLEGELRDLVLGMQGEIAGLRVLDPACGSGNFLYVALKQLLDLEKEVIVWMGDHGLTRPFPAVGPEQLHGIEINDYAHELAQITVWIGYIQWLRDNGWGQPSEPILKPLDTIRQMDAILAHDTQGQPSEPQWPQADVIIGNPPFLGGKRMRSELGDKYVDELFHQYEGRVPHEADLVTYWFERVRALIADDQVRRAGLLATNSIRGGANRRVLEHIKQTGDIFMAWADRSWVLNGAAVRVSMVGFDNGNEQERVFDGAQVQAINADLTASINLTNAQRLRENMNIAFMGDTKVGPFEIDNEAAHKMLAMPVNPNGRPNSDVVVPWVNGLDVTRRPRQMWIIDFGIDMREEEASLYEMPFEYVRHRVKPFRATAKSGDRTGIPWWLHQRPRPDMRVAVAPYERYIATPTVAKHRLFTWLEHPTLPDHQLIVIARDDDYFFGVLHSKLHEMWALRMGTSLEDRPRYTPTTTFETFPFPFPPGHEPHDDPRIAAVAHAARELVAKRDRWLTPPDASPADLKGRTLTNLYNERPTWLDLAHRALDRAVLDAYGWPHTMSDDDILARLLHLNGERA